MTGKFSFKCSCCGKLHEGSPSFGFKAPDPYLEQDEGIKEKGKLSDDLCYYEDVDGIRYFVRTIIEIPIHGISEPFMWGVWVSLSKESYDHYVETWNNPDIDKVYSGRFCSELPYYDSTYPLEIDVHPQENGNRPYLDMHETEHEFYLDFKNGITTEKAQKISELCMHG